MPKSPIFEEYDHECEHDLFNDLYDEAIKVRGCNVYYLPRTLVAEDNIFGEDTESKFESAIELCMWPATVTGFEGQGDLLAQFGFEISERIVAQLAKKEFGDVMRDASVTNRVRPLEGDLIFFPKSKGIFRINNVDKDYPFYVAGANYVWQFSMDLFSYSHEIFATGNDEIDAIATTRQHVILIDLGAGSGTFAVDEQVFQGASYGANTAEATVVSYDDTGSPKTVTVTRPIGNLNILSGNLEGNTSGASYVMDSISLLTDEFGDNQTVEDDADDHLNFDDENPFGET